MSERGKQVSRWHWEDQHQNALQTSILSVFASFKRQVDEQSLEED